MQEKIKNSHKLTTKIFRILLLLLLNKLNLLNQKKINKIMDQDIFDIL